MSALYWNGSTRGNAAFWIPATVRSTCSHGTDSGGMMATRRSDNPNWSNALVSAASLATSAISFERSTSRNLSTTSPRVRLAIAAVTVAWSQVAPAGMILAQSKIASGPVNARIGKARIGNARMGELRMSNARIGKARIGRDCRELAVLKNVPSGDAVRSRSASDSPARARLARVTSSLNWALEVTPRFAQKSG